MGCNCQGQPVSGSRPEAQSPSWLTQAGHAAQAVRRLATAAVAGDQIKASAEVIAARKEICLACPSVSLSQNGLAHRCNTCGCWLDGNVLCKLCLATESCPLGKWGAA